MPSAATTLNDDYETLLIALQDSLGIIVSDRQRNQLLTVLKPLLESYKLSSLAEFANKIQSESSDLRASVLDVITRRFSNWLLSDEIRTVLHKYVFAQLPDEARIWVVGCGQGQLAYSVAMETASYARISGDQKKIKIIATDVAESDIAVAETGNYSDAEMDSISDENRRLYFTQLASGDWQVNEKLRQNLDFKQCDLTDDVQSLGHMDLIICPDMLVYYANGTKAGILRQFSSLLSPGGILLAEHNQVIAPQEAGFERVEHPTGVFYRQKG